MVEADRARSHAFSVIILWVDIASGAAAPREQSLVGAHIRFTATVVSVQSLNDLLPTRFPGVDPPLRDILTGYLAELDAIVIAFGRVEESDEVAEMIALARALSSLLRPSNLTIARTGIHVPTSPSERAGYLALVIRCARPRNSLRTSSSTSHWTPMQRRGEPKAV